MVSFPLLRCSRRRTMTNDRSFCDGEYRKSHEQSASARHLARCSAARGLRLIKVGICSCAVSFCWKFLGQYQSPVNPRFFELHKCTSTFSKILVQDHSHVEQSTSGDESFNVSRAFSKITMLGHSNKPFWCYLIRKVKRFIYTFWKTRSQYCQVDLKRVEN